SSEFTAEAPRKQTSLSKRTFVRLLMMYVVAGQVSPGGRLAWGFVAWGSKFCALRAKRIQGHVEALVCALTEERHCSEVLQVMSAARGAMNSLMAGLLEGHIRSHVLNSKQNPMPDK